MSALCSGVLQDQRQPVPSLLRSLEIPTSDAFTGWHGLDKKATLW